MGEAARTYACAEIGRPVGPLGIAVTHAGPLSLAFGGRDRAETAARADGLVVGQAGDQLEQVVAELRAFGGGLEVKRRLLALEGVLSQTFDDLLTLG